MSGLHVVPFPGPDINDIPARLRSVADMIESGEFENDIRAFVWIIVKADGDTETGAIGRCHDRMHAAGIMQAAAHKLLTGSHA